MIQGSPDVIGGIPTAVDEAAIERRFTSAFGVSSEQFREKLDAEFAQASPEEQAEFEQLVEQANKVLPEIHASLDRIGERLRTMNVATLEISESMVLLGQRIGNIESSLGFPPAATVQ